MRFQEKNGYYTSNLDCNQTINQFGVEELVLAWNECEILTHSQQQPQAPNAHKNKSTVRLTTRITMLWAPKGLSFTGSWSQLRSSARHTLSNQEAQLKQLRLFNLTENDGQHTFKAPCCCFENAPNTDLLFFEQSM